MIFALEGKITRSKMGVIFLRVYRKKQTSAKQVSVHT